LGDHGEDVQKAADRLSCAQDNESLARDLTMTKLLEDIRASADWIAAALSSSGYRADFSLSSLREIDRFFDEHSRNGEPVPNGLLSESLGSRLFAVGGYIGEVIRRLHGGHWEANDDDPDGEINIAFVLPSGATIWPVQRAMKRFKNGKEDGIYAYGAAMVEGTPQYPQSPSPPKRPWWKFW
jgi:hypothetical protein